MAATLGDEGGSSTDEPAPIIPPAPTIALLNFDSGFIAACRPFLAQFDRPKLRFMFLLIVGDSKTGKSVFAEHALGFRSPFINKGEFNIGGFRRDQHDAIILSDVPGIAKIILKYKAVFQSNGKVTTIGESTTSWAAVKINTHKTPIVVTMNKEGDWATIKTQQWILANCFVVDCADKPMFTEDADSPAAESQSLDAADSAAAKATWTAVLAQD